MSAAAALQAALDAGIALQVDDEGYLSLEAEAPPPTAILDLLLRHKAAVIMLLRQGEDGWSSEDWQDFYNERAGIAEFDVGLSRNEAESRAFACCIAEWLNRNPVRSPPGQCLGCGGLEQIHDPLLPFGTETSGYVWVHRRCWETWHAGRRSEADAALAAMGILECSTRS